MQYQIFIYRVLLNFLVLEVKKITFGANKNHEALLKAWDESINVFKLMEGIIKEVTNPIPFLGALLKYGRLFLGMNLKFFQKISNIPKRMIIFCIIDHFLKHGMPVLDKLFNRRREDCAQLLKIFQSSTRYMHHFCNHSKIKKNVALSNHVPLLKKSLEAFVFR